MSSEFLIQTESKQSKNMGGYNSKIWHRMKSRTKSFSHTLTRLENAFNFSSCSNSGSSSSSSSSNSSVMMMMMVMITGRWGHPNISDAPRETSWMLAC